MLTGTLVTAAGFLPIATAKSGTGEYTRSIFEVVTIALLISWFAAVMLIPYLGYKLLPERDAPTPTARRDREPPARAGASALIARLPARAAAWQSAPMRKARGTRSVRDAVLSPFPRGSSAGAWTIARP